MSHQPTLRADSLARHGLRHGFTTRQGGVSQGPFASFNLSLLVGDDPQAVARNRTRFEEYTGLAWSSVAGLRQVHGDEALLVDRPASALGPPDDLEFDAALSDRPDVTLAVRTADCVPILLFCPAPRAVAAVHAGWRGSLSGIAGKVVGRLGEAFACKPQDLLAVIGPCIGRARFEVGPEVFGPFRDRFGAGVAVVEQNQTRVDLVAANRQVLEAADLAPDRIEVLDLCTFDRDDLFFSHRRDRGRTGRQMAYISLAP